MFLRNVQSPSFRCTQDKKSLAYTNAQQVPRSSRILAMRVRSQSSCNSISLPASISRKSRLEKQSSNPGFPPTPFTWLHASTAPISICASQRPVSPSLRKPSCLRFLIEKSRIHLVSKCHKIRTFIFSNCSLKNQN